MELWRHCRSTAQRQNHSITKSVRRNGFLWSPCTWNLYQNLPNANLCAIDPAKHNDSCCICVDRELHHGSYTFSALAKLPDFWLVESRFDCSKEVIGSRTRLELEQTSPKISWNTQTNMAFPMNGLHLRYPVSLDLPSILARWNPSRSVLISTKFDYHLLHSTLHFSLHIGSPSPQVSASTEANEHDNDQDETSKPGGCHGKPQPPLNGSIQLNSCSCKNNNGGICLSD